MKILPPFLLLLSLVVLAGCHPRPIVHVNDPRAYMNEQRNSAADTSKATTQPAPEHMTLDDAAELLDHRSDWHDFPPLHTAFPRNPEEKYLKGLTVVLDPGHGGDAMRPGYKRGPTGVREAEINLRVAKLLQRLLTDAGVTVLLTRDIDRDLSLADRAGVANDANADLFISLHHNADGNAAVNYTSVWVHGDPKQAGPELDVARSVSLALGRHLRTQVGYTSPVMSDRQIYQSGFGVLRAARVPALLCESSFHTNPDEEQRLDDARHNLREAYAIYEGLCDYAYTGRPTQSVELKREGDALWMTARLDDGLPEWWGHERRGPVPTTLAVTVDGSRVDYNYDAETHTLSAALPADAKSVGLAHENIFGHRNWPRTYAVEAGETAVSLATRPTTRLADNDPPPASMPAKPWLGLDKIKLPAVLLDGGATAGSQATLDAIPMPAGSALTICRVDPHTGDLRAVRWRDTGRLGFYPASTVKLVTANLTLRQLADLNLTPQATLKLGDEPAKPVADLLRAMIADSDNEAFNTLQETAGFAETAAYLKTIGAGKLAIRRHFTTPHWSTSREAVFQPAGDGQPVVVPARPDPNLPKNADGGASNWADTDDLVRLLAATFITESRDLPGFDGVADALRDNNEPFVGRGLDELGGFAVYGKPGWWPPDGAHVDAAYVYDARNDRHYFVGLYWQGPPQPGDDADLTDARKGIAAAMRQAFAAIRDGRIRL